MTSSGELQTGVVFEFKYEFSSNANFALTHTINDWVVHLRVNIVCQTICAAPV